MFKFLENVSDKGMKGARIGVLALSLLATGASAVLGLEQASRDQKEVEETIAKEARSQVQREFENMNNNNNNT